MNGIIDLLMSMRPISPAPADVPYRPLSAPLSDNPAPALAPTGLPAAPSADSGAVALPAWMGLDAGMTPLQMRTSIATGGLNGDGRYTNPEAGNFWRNLIRQGQSDFGFSLLPIEEQYAQNVLGIAPQNGEKLLQAILRG